LIHSFYQDSLVVSRKAKKKQNVHAHLTRLPVCYLQLHTNAVKFASAVTKSFWALTLSFYRSSTFLPCRISNPKMNKLGATVVKNQPFWLFWCLFFYLRLKLYHLENNSIVTRELNTFVLCRMNKPKFITIPSITFVMQLSILHPSTKKNLERSFFSQPLLTSVFLKK